jgi:hypothetical protein
MKQRDELHTLPERRIEKAFYPVFPPDRNAEDVIKWLTTNPI